MSNISKKKRLKSDEQSNTKEVVTTKNDTNTSTVTTPTTTTATMTTTSNSHIQDKQTTLYRIETIPGKGQGVIANVDIPAGVDILVSAGVIVADGDHISFCSFCAIPRTPIDPPYKKCTVCQVTSFCLDCYVDDRLHSIHEKECGALLELSSSKWKIQSCANETKVAQDVALDESAFYFYGRPEHAIAEEEDEVEDQEDDDDMMDEDLMDEDGSMEEDDIEDEDVLNDQNILEDQDELEECMVDEYNVSDTTSTSTRKKQNKTDIIIDTNFTKYGIGIGSTLLPEEYDFQKKLDEEQELIDEAMKEGYDAWDGLCLSVITPHPLFGVKGKCKCENCVPTTIKASANPTDPTNPTETNSFHMVSDHNLHKHVKIHTKFTKSAKLPTPEIYHDNEYISRRTHEGSSFLRLLIRLLAHRRQEIEETGFSRRKKVLPDTITEWDKYQYKAVAQLYGFGIDDYTDEELSLTTNTVQQAIHLLGSSARCNRDDVFQILGKLYANSMQLATPQRFCAGTNTYDTMKLSRPMKDVATGIFPEASRFNHSCLPNCYYSYNAIHHPGIEKRGFSKVTPSLTIRTLRPIKAGDELYISYVSPLFETKVRRAMLQKTFHFECSCARCQSWTYERCELEAAKHIRCITIPRIMQRIEDNVDDINEICETMNSKKYVPIPALAPTSSSSAAYTPRRSLLRTIADLQSTKSTTSMAPTTSTTSTTSTTPIVSSDNISQLQKFSCTKEEYLLGIKQQSTLWKPYTLVSVPEFVSRGYWCNCGEPVSLTSLQFAKQSLLQDTFECSLESTNEIISSGHTAFWPHYKDIFLSEILVAESNIQTYYIYIRNIISRMHMTIGVGGLVSQSDVNSSMSLVENIIQKWFEWEIQKAQLQESLTLVSSLVSLQNLRTQFVYCNLLMLHLFNVYIKQYKINLKTIHKMSRMVPVLYKYILWVSQESIKVYLLHTGYIASLYDSHITRTLAFLDMAHKYNTELQNIIHTIYTEYNASGGRGDEYEGEGEGEGGGENGDRDGDGDDGIDDENSIDDDNDISNPYLTKMNQSDQTENKDEEMSLESRHRNSLTNNKSRKGKKYVYDHNIFTIPWENSLDKIQYLLQIANRFGSNYNHYGYIGCVDEFDQDKARKIQKTKYQCVNAVIGDIETIDDVQVDPHHNLVTIKEQLDINTAFLDILSLYIDPPPYPL